MSKDNEVTLKVDWIKRLKFYTDSVRSSTDNDGEHKMAIIALLGYLESLEFLIHDKQVKNMEECKNCKCREAIRAATILEVHDVLHGYAMQTKDTATLDILEKIQEGILVL